MKLILHILCEIHKNVLLSYKLICSVCPFLYRGKDLGDVCSWGLWVTLFLPRCVKWILSTLLGFVVSKSDTLIFRLEFLIFSSMYLMTMNILWARLSCKCIYFKDLYSRIQIKALRIQNHHFVNGLLWHSELEGKEWGRLIKSVGVDKASEGSWQSEWLG